MGVQCSLEKNETATMFFLKKTFSSCVLNFQAACSPILTSENRKANIINFSDRQYLFPAYLIYSKIIDLKISFGFTVE